MAKRRKNKSSDDLMGFVQGLLGGKSEDAVKKYDEAEEHMIHLADTLAEGIIAQFPDKF